MNELELQRLHDTTAVVVTRATTCGQTLDLLALESKATSWCSDVADASPVDFC